jgi:hypothetical protein
MAETSNELWKEIERLLVNAQNCGTVRSDISIQVVRRLLTGLARSLDSHLPSEKDVLEDLILVVIDGMRTR